MNRKSLIKATMLLLVAACAALAAAAAVGQVGPGQPFDRYHTFKEIADRLAETAKADPGFVKLHNLGKSAGGSDILVLEIGSETAKDVKTVPAVFVAADMEGTVPLSSEAALYLVKLLVDKPEARKGLTWYILPCGNPDAAGRFFAKPLFKDARNARQYNDDMDDQVDEDGPEDLNGDGVITMMRVKDPQGEWLPVPGEPKLMKRADWSKGEKGIYKLYSEGIDNDHDGLINEDGPGGVDVGTNFPHLFKFFTPESGPWAGSENETYSLMRFFDNHREIGLTFAFGEDNFCLNPPRGGRKGDADTSHIKIPENFAGMLGADPNKTYTMDEIMDMVRPLVPPGMELTESMIASFLGLGAVVNPVDDDLKFYTELSDKYKEFLKAAKLDGKRLDPAPDKDGSFELWTYYHLGLPSFALDFWTPPVPEEKKSGDELTSEKVGQMTNQEFIALGEEKIDAFLKASGAPAQFKAKNLIEALKGGAMDTKKMAEMMKQMPKPGSSEGADPREKAVLAFSDKELGGKGFVDWKPFKHPDLGDVEIGGVVPFVDNTPPAKMIEPLLKGQVPWVFEISSKMARIRLADVKVKSLGGGLYEVKAMLENSGGLPYPTAMGARNLRNLPVILTIEGKDYTIIDGKKRSKVETLKPLEIKPVAWILRADKPVKITVHADTQIAWSDARTVEIGGGK